ncbi:MAG: GMC family oxidoreductase [Proteobacteria bacterium]|nr:GMC family oxidoreductase [Pseudomonadota bacterium]
MFDYLIVGAGSAGAILAARLSENPAIRVMLIEAGPDYADEPAMPPDLLDYRDLAGIAHDWRYTANPIDGRTIAYRRGKVVGGTSAINAAAAQWGQPAEYDDWARLGNTEWRWPDVAPWFRRLETDRDGVGSHHGRDGPVPIARHGSKDLIPMQRAFHAACVSAGFADVRDHNTLDGSGVGPWPMNRIGDTRVSTAISHLKHARSRGNLTIRGGCLVDRLILDDSCVAGVRLATGDIVHGNTTVLCAGAIGSPAILMRSGIGPRANLEAIGIATRLDLPGVGARLWDHAAVPIYLVPHPGECVIGRDPRFQILARFGSSGSMETDDMQLVLTTHLDLTAMPAFRAEAGVPVVAALRVALMRPRGHGRLTLTSRDPAVQPRIDLNFCADGEDVRRLMVGVRLAWRVVKSEAMSHAYQRVVGLTDDIVESDQQLDGYMRANVGTYCHATGTVPMGPDGDPRAVVDQRCRVRGIGNLFVVDASVFPVAPRVVPNFTIMMLGERVASWLAEH